MMAEFQAEGGSVPSIVLMKQVSPVWRRLIGNAGWAIPLVGIGVVAAVASLYATKWGPWLYSDGAGYIMLARNLLAGRGLGLVRASGEFQPLSMHPPLYPLALAGLGLTGAELLGVARWFGAALFAFTIVIVGLAIFHLSHRPWLALAAATVTLASPQLVRLYTGVLSEPLFIVTGFGSVLLLLVYFATPRPWALILSGLAAGLSALTRYPGVAFIGAGILALLLFSRSRRLVGTLSYAAMAVALNLIWLTWMSRQVGADPPREWNWNLVGLWERSEPIRGGIVAEAWKWIPFETSLGPIPYALRLAIFALVGLAVALVLFLSLHKMDRSSMLESRPLQLAVLMALFSSAYLAILAAVFLFSLPPLEASDIDQRIMTPVYLAVVLGAFSSFSLVIGTWPRRIEIQLVGVGVTLLALAWLLPESWNLTRQLGKAGEGYTSPEWMSSETLRQARALPEGMPIITNESTALMLHLDRAAYDLPQIQQAERASSFSRFGDGNTAEERVFREEGAALVLFDSIRWQLHGIYGGDAEFRLERLTQGLHLHVLTEDGAIYFYDDIRGTNG